MNRAVTPRWIGSVALLAALTTPLFSVHGRAMIEVSIGLTDALFLLDSAWRRDWAWLRSGLSLMGLLWWGWLVICSLPGIGSGGAGSLLQAVLALRLMLFVTALRAMVLRAAPARRWLGVVFDVAFFYILAQAALQLVSGHNLFGDPRGADGELTGPYRHPDAGIPMELMLYPVLMPLIGWLAARRGAAGGGMAGRFGAGAVAFGGIATMVLIGQRMPLARSLLGLLIAALLLRPLRRVALGVAVAVAVLIVASAAIAPPTYHRLVVKFSDQLEHLHASPYGLIFTRALSMAEQHPLTGLGYDGFRSHCADPRYFQSRLWPADPAVLADPAGCNQHPHNFYLHAVTDAGLPGLLLFTALGIGWLLRLGHGLRRRPDPLRVGLFVAACLYLWPIGGSSGYLSMPFSGFFFTLIGWGLAEADALGDAAPLQPEETIA